MQSLLYRIPENTTRITFSNPKLFRIGLHPIHLRRTFAILNESSKWVGLLLMRDLNLHNVSNKNFI